MLAITNTTTIFHHVYPDTLGSAQTKSVGEMPSHKHKINSYNDTGGGVFALKDNENGSNGWKISAISACGNDEYHNNISPCISGYAWIRTN
jgi:microcystin-dependent protein